MKYLYKNNVKNIEKETIDFRDSKCNMYINKDFLQSELFSKILHVYLHNVITYMYVLIYIFCQIFSGIDGELKATLFSHNSASGTRHQFSAEHIGEYKERHGGPLRVHVYIKSSRRQLYEATPCNYLWASNDRTPGKSQPIFQRAFYAPKASFRVTH